MEQEPPRGRKEFPHVTQTVVQRCSGVDDISGHNEVVFTAIETLI